ncbi:DUF1772 domain-containing protein [Streptomyces sp. MS1.AVA.1]|uniref:DUF1772 domain-containing protein n=1 Tax=Streptomyces machairae TaxID=3134109 RepID=A0ABU8UN62_9ACTN
MAFVVTVLFNVPLNDSLKGAGDPTALREEFEDPWLAWNVVRTVLSTVALGCLGRALVLYGRITRVAAQHRSAQSSPSGV